MNTKLQAVLFKSLRRGIGRTYTTIHGLRSANIPTMFVVSTAKEIEKYTKEINNPNVAVVTQQTIPEVLFGFNGNIVLDHFVLEAWLNEGCIWTDIEDEFVYQTECGKIFQFEEPTISLNGFLYCFNCGKRIQDK